MSKIGDLFVRLGLKNDDYKKGMKDAQKQTKNFGGGLKEMKATAIAVWAAVGASVIKFGKDMINATQKIGDAWNRMTSSVKAGWDSFVQSLSNFDFSNFAQRVKETGTAARALTDVKDLQFEVVNSVRLQKALLADNLSQLRIAMMDATKSYEDRLEAAKDYIKKIEPIYQQEIKMAQKLLDATSDKWLAGTNLAGGKNIKQDLTKFLIDYGNLNDTALANLVNDYVKAKNDYNNYKASTNVLDALREYDNTRVIKKQDEEKAALKANLDKIEASLRDFGKRKGYTNFLGDLGEIYNNWRGDADTKPLVDAVVAAAEAEAALNSENRKIKNLINTLQAAINAQAAAKTEEQKKLQKKVYDFQYKQGLKYIKDDAEFQKAAKAINEELFAIDDIEIDMSFVEAEMDAFIEEFQKDVAEVQEICDMLSETIAQSLAAGMQSLFNVLFKLEDADFSQVVAALLEPFADTAVQLGTMLVAQGVAITAFKTSLADLNGPAAIAAGVTLIAVGSAMKAGIQALANNRGATAGGGDTSGGNAYESGSYETYGNTITIEVVGKISGSDILISGSKQQSKWNR